MCNVDLVFKPAGEDVKVLILHSTEDDAGQTASNLLRWKLKNTINIAGEYRVHNFPELIVTLEKNQDFNVLVFIAHGDKDKHLPFLYADINQKGDSLILKYNELAAALKDKVDDKLCLFGVCYSGTRDLAKWICEEAGAIACVAPRSCEEIDIGDIGCAYGALINKMQEQKQYPSDIAMLHDVLVPELKKETQRKLAIYPVSPQRLY